MEKIRNYLYKKMHNRGFDEKPEVESGLNDGLPIDETKKFPLPNGDVTSEGTSSSESTQDEGVKVHKRETWSNKIDFLLACIGFSVGLGNVWRFPYLCYKNGGGAFLIPYFICVILGGIPMFFLEVALGQFMSEGGIGAWKICPLLQGIGYATTCIVFFLNTYYNVILSWAFYYLFASFTSILPWTSCGNEWNSVNCRTDWGNSTSNSTNSTANLTLSLGNDTKGVDAVTEFWENKVLRISAGIDQAGTVKWDLALCLLLAWIVVYFCIWKGVKSSGKVMYFTATSPYILMTVLLIRGCTLDGAAEGIKFYMIPKWERLADMQVWVDAGTQIFFSYSISLGALTALGSYNKFHHNSWRDSIIFACTNSGTSLFAGFVIFSVLGFMAKQQGVDVGEVAESGPGLAFIAYPKAVSQMPVAPLWSIMFFFMVILLGLDSQFVGVEGFVTAVTDMFPRQLRVGYNREFFILGTCAVSFLIGLSMVTEGGMYVFQLFDFYSGSRIILVVAFFECIAIAYLYGVNRFHDNLEMMYGFRVVPIMKFMWPVVTPIFVMTIFIMSGITYSELTYNRIYEYPKWAIGIGWTLASISAVMIPLVMAIQILKTEGSFFQRIHYLIKPRLRRHQLRDVDNDPDELASESDTGSPYFDDINSVPTEDQSMNTEQKYSSRESVTYYESNC